MGSRQLKALFDTNVLVECLAGFDQAAAEVDRYQNRFVSRVVWIEFLVGARSADVESRRRSFLDQFNLLEVDEAVSEEAVLLRRRTRLRLADAIILATARVHGLLLVTRNTRDFSRNDPDIRIPY